MDAIRQFVDVKNRSFQVTLPDDFKACRVEVIILPLQGEVYQLAEKTKKMLDNRLRQYHQKPSDVYDFEQLLEEMDDEI